MIIIGMDEYSDELREKLSIPSASKATVSFERWCEIGELKWPYFGKTVDESLKDALESYDAGWTIHDYCVTLY